MRLIFISIILLSYNALFSQRKGTLKGEDGQEIKYEIQRNDWNDYPRYMIYITPLNFQAKTNLWLSSEVDGFVNLGNAFEVRGSVEVPWFEELNDGINYGFSKRIEAGLGYKIIDKVKKKEVEIRDRKAKSRNEYELNRYIFNNISVSRQIFLRFGSLYHSNNVKSSWSNSDFEIHNSDTTIGHAESIESSFGFYIGIGLKQIHNLAVKVGSVKNIEKNTTVRS